MQHSYWTFFGATIQYGAFLLATLTGLLLVKVLPTNFYTMASQAKFSSPFPLFSFLECQLMVFASLSLERGLSLAGIYHREDTGEEVKVLLKRRLLSVLALPLSVVSDK